MPTLAKRLTELRKGSKHCQHGRNWKDQLTPKRRARYEAAEVTVGLPYDLRSHASVGNNSKVIYCSPYQDEAEKKDRVIPLLQAWAKRHGLKIRLEPWTRDEECGTHVTIYGW